MSWLLTLRRLLFKPAVFGLLLAAAVLAQPAAAQNDPWPEPGPDDAIGISAILDSTDSTHIVTYSETEVGYNVEQYYGAGVAGYLFENNAEVQEGWVQDPEDAHGYFGYPLTVGDTYEIDSYHYLLAEYYEVYDGVAYYENPQEFLNFAGTGINPSGSQFAPGGGPDYYTFDDIFLGATGVWISTGVPSITSIDTQGAAVGTSGTITLGGSYLLDLFTQDTTPAITGSGVTLTKNSLSDTQVVLNYSIATNASTGADQITLSTRFGTSNPVTFNVGDPTPVVHVSPTTWPAGADTTITITGSGFGTNPSVSVSSSDVTVSVTTKGDTQIVAKVSVAPDAQDQTATVKVQSNGYNGSGFLGVTPSQPSSGTDTANVTATLAPQPNIRYGTDTSVCSSGGGISGGQPVVVGQQIALVGCPTPPPGLSMSSQSWQVSGTYVGGYNASSNSGQLAQPPTLTNSTVVFYWIYPGRGMNVTYSYCMSNKKCSTAQDGSAPAQATFNVAGPPAVNVQAQPSGVTISTLLDCDGTPYQAESFGSLQGIAPMHGNACVSTLAGTPGILINEAVTQPSPSNITGTFSWVNLVDTNESQWIWTNGPGSCQPASGLDFQYPTATGNSFDDSPFTPLSPTVGEFQRFFKARTFLMWDPSLPGPGQASCTAATPGNAGTCASIPLPLGYLAWQWSGDVINTLDTHQGVKGTTWKISCNQKSAGQFQQNAASQSPYGYPTWSSLTAKCNIPW